MYSFSSRAARNTSSSNMLSMHISIFSSSGLVLTPACALTTLQLQLAVPPVSQSQVHMHAGRQPAASSLTTHSTTTCITALPHHSQLQHILVGTPQPPSCQLPCSVHEHIKRSRLRQDTAAASTTSCMNSLQGPLVHQVSHCRADQTPQYYHTCSHVQQGHHSITPCHTT